MRMASTSARRSLHLARPGPADQAKSLGINVSRTCEAALRAQVKVLREERWLRENAAAIEQMNRWVEEHGLPLAAHRQF